MPKIEGECIKDQMNFLARQFKGSESDLADGGVEIGDFKCSFTGCPVVCALKGEVKRGKIIKVEVVGKGGNCVVNG
jgi:hypothetical protein